MSEELNNKPTEPKTSAKSTVTLGTSVIPTRITVKRIKRVKELTGLDLTTQDPQIILDFSVDPRVLVEVASALYSDHLKDAGITVDDMDELCGPEEITALREEVIHQMGSFSKFWRIVSTEMENLLSGDTSLVEKVAALKQGTPSGTSS